MRVYIADIEVFALNWVFVCREPESTDYTVIHNDNHAIREFFDNHKNDAFGFFNGKNYDSWIILSMLLGGDNTVIKKHNDFIIGGNNGWEFPFIQFQKRPFYSFDLRDDLPLGLSLKAIEGNMGSSIVESSVPFDIDRPLTPKEIEEVISYCKTDVDRTVDLYRKRKKYIDSKLFIAKLKGIPPEEAIGLTNAKLTARFLDAVPQDFGDEFIYESPEELRIDKYKHVCDFFYDPITYTLQGLHNQLKNETRKIKIKSLTTKIEKLKTSNNRYDCKLETTVAGVPHVYGWGGIHGAVNNYFMKSDPNYRIVTVDVGSYYPSMALEYNYASRAIPSVDGYRNVYNTRMNAKHSGDKATADALKLILNTFYGAMKNRYNDLYDPRNASAICITGMLLLTDLIEKLESVDGFELIQSNTDGIIIRYPIKVESQIEAIVSEWESRTRLNMEYTVIKAIAQKDVNNYVMKAGETYLIKDGKKVVTDEDKGKLKTKGGYVSLFGGGDFKNNSMVIIHKALVNYFMDGVPIAETILNSDNLEDFQIIAKTGSTYDGTYWEVDGEKIEVQRVNRVYATTNTRYGTVYKRKNGKDTVEESTEINDEGRSDKIASLPEHCIVDNEHKLTIDDIDKGFYIDLALKRAGDYLGDKKIKMEVFSMAETKTEAKTSTPKKPLNIYQKLSKARLDFLKAGVKKNGVNRHSEYDYFELADIVPVATEIFDKHGLLFVTTFPEGNPTGILYDMDSDATIIFNSARSDERLVTTGGKTIMLAIQETGAKETYQRRYLYMQVLDIVENDAIDAGTTKDEKDETPAPKKAVTKSNKVVTPEKREEIKKELTDENGEATETQIKSIKKGLKKLREKDEKYEPYIAKTLKEIKSGLSKKEAEDKLIEIGNKVEE